MLHDRCAAVDVSKRDVKVCLRTPGKERNQRRTAVRTFATTTNELLAVRDWLPAELVNARQVKAMPGRKTDVVDSVWLAQLAECGLLPASFVPLSRSAGCGT